jgi:hypothetical protein
MRLTCKKGLTNPKYKGTQQNLIDEKERVQIYAGLRVTLGTKPDTQTLNPKYPDLDPKYPNPHYPISCLDSKSYYPNLYRVIWVVTPGTQKTRIGIRIRLPAIKCSSKLVKFPMALLDFASQLTHLFTSVFVSLTPRDSEFPCEAQALL